MGGLMLRRIRGVRPLCRSFFRLGTRFCLGLNACFDVVVGFLLPFFFLWSLVASMV